MKAMIAIAMALTAAPALAADGPMPTYSTLPPDLAAAARDFDQAQVKGDRAALERLLADDYLLINSQDAGENKSEFIADYTAPGFTMEPFAIERPVQQVWATGAVLGGVVEAKGMSGGKPYVVRLRFADVWAKRGGKWVVIFTQANHVAATK